MTTPKSPFLLRLFTEGQEPQITSYQDQSSAEHQLVRELNAQTQSATVELWQYRDSEDLYELVKGVDKLFEPVTYEYDASMLSDDVDRVRWNGEADTYLYQPENY
jgi:hypothetical protein